jgi:hypothetical protein
MGKLDQHVAPPRPVLSDDGDGSKCPDCKHERGEPYYSPWAPLARRLGFKPRAAECEWRPDLMETGCGCDNPFHGS